MAGWSVAAGFSRLFGLVLALVPLAIKVIGPLWARASGAKADASH